jgi:hypothetical protein
MSLELPQNPNLVSLKKIAAANRPFTIPWPNSLGAPHTVTPNAPFHVSRIDDDPFKGTRAFNLRDLPEIEFVPATGKNMWSEVRTSSMSSSYEHLGVKGGVGVDAGVVKASVSVSYDKETISSKNAVKISTRARHIHSVVQYKTAPPLSAEAIELLKKGGEEEFRKVYGEYYIGGLVIGAEAAVLFESKVEHESETETLAVTVKVTVLFWSAEVSVNKSFSSESGSTEISMSAFDTLSSSILPSTALTDSNFGKLREQYQGKVNRLEQRVKEVVEKCKDKDIDELASQGAVLEVVLVPYSQLKEYQDTLSLRETLASSNEL